MERLLAFCHFSTSDNVIRFLVIIYRIIKVTSVILKVLLTLNFRGF